MLTHTESAPYILPDAAEFLAWNNARPESQTGGDMAPQAMRAWYRKRASICDLPVGNLAEILDFAIPTPAGELPARLFDVHANRSAGPVVVCFHGGGFVFGDLDSHAGFCAEMNRVLDVPVVSVQYRCAPVGKWTAARDDCEFVARWVSQSPTTLGRLVTSLVLCVDSAGGTLTIGAMDLRDRPAQVPVIVQAPIYPAVDEEEQHPSYHEFAEGYLLTQAGMQWMQFHYRADAASHRAAPLNDDLKGLPPAVRFAKVLRSPFGGRRATFIASSIFERPSLPATVTLMTTWLRSSSSSRSRTGCGLRREHLSQTSFKRPKLNIQQYLCRAFQMLGAMSVVLW